MVVYDEVTTGAENDLKEAIAGAPDGRPVGHERRGRPGLPGDRRGACLPRPRDHAGQGVLRCHAERLDNAVREMVEGALDRAVQVAVKNRDNWTHWWRPCSSTRRSMPRKSPPSSVPVIPEGHPEAGIVPQQMVTVEATVRENGRAAGESATDDAKSLDSSLAPVGVAANPQRQTNRVERNW